MRDDKQRPGVGRRVMNFAEHHIGHGVVELVAKDHR